MQEQAETRNVRAVVEERQESSHSTGRSRGSERLTSAHRCTRTVDRSARFSSFHTILLFSTILSRLTSASTSLRAYAHASLNGPGHHTGVTLARIQ
jgi:hypothetical protein